MTFEVTINPYIFELTLIIIIGLVLLSAWVFKGWKFMLGMIGTFALLFVLGFTLKNFGHIADRLNFVGERTPAPIVAASARTTSATPTPTAPSEPEVSSRAPQAAETAHEVEEPAGTSEVVGDSATEDSVFSLSGEGVVDGTFEDGTPYRLYTVERGDSVYGLSQRFGVSQLDIVERNDIHGYVIRVGRDLRIPLE